MESVKEYSKKEIDRAVRFAWRRINEISKFYRSAKDKDLVYGIAGAFELGLYAGLERKKAPSEDKEGTV